MKLTKIKRIKARNERPEELCQKSIVSTVLKPLEGLGYLTYAHSPNELARTPFLRRLMAAMGMRSGIADLIIFLPGGRCIFIELKMKGEYQSENQKFWEVRVTDLGFKYYVVTCADKFDGQAKVIEILKSNGVPI